MKAVGARLPRYDGIEHVTGRTQYVDDVKVPGTLWTKALRSPHHSATFSGLDTSKAEAMPGVRAADGTVRLAATGLAGHGARLRAAEAAAGDPEAAGAAAVGDVTLGDDALASAWYRGRALPVLVRRVLAKLGEAA